MANPHLKGILEPEDFPEPLKSYILEIRDCFKIGKSSVLLDGFPSADADAVAISDWALAQSIGLVKKANLREYADWKSEYEIARKVCASLIVLMYRHQVFSTTVPYAAAQRAARSRKFDVDFQHLYDQYAEQLAMRVSSLVQQSPDSVARPTVPEDLNEDSKTNILKLFSAVAEPKELGELLRAAREDQGLSQAELGRRMGVSRATVNKIEIGSGNPTWKTLTSYALALSSPE